MLIFLVMPAGNTYQLNDFGFGGGGVGDASSSSYSLNATVGEVSGSTGVGTLYNLNPGLQFTQQAGTPAAPTLSNGSGTYYNKLNVTINNGGNPTDTVFAIAVSTDSFSSTNFIQADHTIGATAVYQDYTTWGSGTGFLAIGLSPGTIYYFKVSAKQGKYSESAFSSVASLATVTPSLSFDIDVSATDAPTNSPYNLSLGTLSLGSVTTATNKIWISLDTNGLGGGFVYVYDNNTGLHSTSANYTISSATTNLTSASEGFGLQSSTATQTSGGPLTPVSPYNNSSENVGIVNTASQTLYTTSSAPIVGGRGSLFVKVKASTTTPTASDYSDTLTMIASSTF